MDSLSKTKEEIRHEVVSEDNLWVLGKTYHNITYFGDWTKYKGDGNPATSEELAETERKRIEIAEVYRIANPREPSKDYYETIKRWNLIKKD